MFDASVNPSLESNRLLFSQKEAASILGVSLRTIQNLVVAKELPIRRIGRRVLVHRKDLETFARRDHFAFCKGGKQ
jgi:excisionase family DNA binding protein